jgi:hypothetical protein
MESNKKDISVEEIRCDGFYRLIKNNLSSNEFYIFREYLKNELDNNIFSIKEFKRENLIYNSYVEVPLQGKIYESIKFSNEIDFSLINKIYEFVVEKENKLSEALNEVNKLLLDLSSIINMSMVRGTFAEMKLILDNGFNCSTNKYSIFDATNNNQDIEIKSFSKIKYTVEISYQQLTNSENAIFYFAEVIESSDGQSIFELYELLNIEEKKRFS